MRSPKSAGRSCAVASVEELSTTMTSILRCDWHSALCTASSTSGQLLYATTTTVTRSRGMGELAGECGEVFARHDLVAWRRDLFLHEAPVAVGRARIADRIVDRDDATDLQVRRPATVFLHHDRIGLIAIDEQQVDGLRPAEGDIGGAAGMDTDPALEAGTPDVFVERLAQALRQTGGAGAVERCGERVPGGIEWIDAMHGAGPAQLARTREQDRGCTDKGADFDHDRIAAEPVA